MTTYAYTPNVEMAKELEKIRVTPRTHTQYLTAKIDQFPASPLSSLEKMKYLKSSNFIPSDNLEIKELSKYLVKDTLSEQDKVLIIHDFVAFHITHAGTLPDDQIKRETQVCRQEAKYTDIPVCPWFDAETSFRTQLGHCGTIAALSVAMLRAVGIPSRVLIISDEGARIYREKYKTAIYHQWTEMYLRGRWVQMDVTFDSFSSNNFKSIDYGYFKFSKNLTSEEDIVHKFYEIKVEQ